MDHQAFAELLGNYGEFVGAIAVVVTLGYLAVQIRENTKSNYVSRLHSVQSEIARVHEQAVAHDSLALLLSRCRDSEPTDLSPPDHERLLAWATQFTTVYRSVEQAHQEGQLDERTYQAYCADCKRIIHAFPILKSKMRSVVEGDRVQDYYHHSIFEPLFE